MAKSRSTPSPKRRPFVSSLGFAGGNGSPVAETDAERLARMEEVLARIQTTLDTQFQRIADMQVLIDRLTAERNR
jgi:hypothetical protein